MDEIIVVSEIGEEWSPNIPPEMTAAMTKGICRSIVAPKAKAIGIMIEKVPQLVPVENAVMLATKKLRSGISTGEMLPVNKYAQNLAVPR